MSGVCVARVKLVGWRAAGSERREVPSWGRAAVGSNGPEDSPGLGGGPARAAAGRPWRRSVLPKLPKFPAEQGLCLPNCLPNRPAALPTATGAAPGEAHTECLGGSEP